MKKKLFLNSLIFTLVFFCFFADAANQTGDTITINTKRFKLLSANLITNSGFENGFTGWTDATTSAALLTTTKFSIAVSGGVGNSKYLIGLNNENSSSSGSVGTSWPVASGKTYLFSYQVKYLSAAALAGSELYLKTSLTNDRTASAEPKILINSTDVNGGGAWTQNYVYFTNSNPVYNYLKINFRWLGNRLGFDDFMLYEAVEIANNEALQTVVDEATALYNVSAKGAAELQTAIQTAQSFLSSTSSTEVTKAISDLQKAIQIFKYANASPDNPLDMTSFIVNPNFDGNVTTGWEGGGTANNHEVEFYQKTFDMYQSISGLPAGKYRLRAQGFERPKSNDGGAAYRAGSETISARLYATTPDYSEVNVEFNSLYKHSYTGTGSLNGYVNNMSAAEIMLTNAAAYYEMSLSNIILNEGNTLIIGAKSDFQQNGYWALFDNFRLEYLGPKTLSDLVVALNNRTAEAQNLLTKHIQSSVVVTLNTAITQAQTAVNANELVEADIESAKTNIDAAINAAIVSLNAYAGLQKAIADANLIMTFLDKADEITKLQSAIDAALLSYENLSLSLIEINAASNTLKTTTRSVGKRIYVPTWMMGDVYNSSNNWSIERSKQSKNWILFWEPGFGNNPGAIVDDCLALAEKCFDFYADSLKFITKGSSKTDTYKMIIRLRYSSEWEATGSGVDNTIGLLTLTSWALNSRGGQTIAHEVGHCFQYQTHCDNNNMNGWMYGFGANSSGGNGWWEQCAQWQAYKIFPAMQFGNEWISGYLANTHKNLLNETYRYNDFFIQDYWCDLRGMDIIGRLWNQSYKPEDPVETYKRLNVISQSQFNDEMWTCGAKFATWDIPSLKAYGASSINLRPQPKLNNIGNYVWRVDSTVCLENYGHNIIKLNAPTVAKTVTVYFEGLAGINGFRKNYINYAGWRYGFVALLKDGTRVYGDIKSANMQENSGKSSLNFDCPANCDKLWLVVSGAPGIHWRHAWDDDYSSDEQWPYQVSFNNTNMYGYANIYSAVSDLNEEFISIITKRNTLIVNDIPTGSTIRIFNVQGSCLSEEKINGTSFTTTLNSGIYIVSVNTRNGLINRKISIQ